MSAIQKPPCFGHPNVGPRTPCRSCGVILACLRRYTNTHPFGLLMWPRVTDIAPPDDPGVPDARLFNPEVVEAVVRHLGRLPGLRYGAGPRCRAWRLGNERVLRLVAAAHGATTIEVLGKGPSTIALLAAAAAGVELAPSWGALRRPAAQGATVGALLASAEMAPSTLVTSAGWEPAAQVAEEAVRLYFLAWEP